MNKTISQVIYFVWYLIKRPFVPVYKFFNNITTKPKKLMRLMIILTLIALFEENLMNFIIRLKPDIHSPLFLFFLTASLIIYIWKSSDPRFGETWKKEWQERIEEKQAAKLMKIESERIAE